MVEAGQVQRRQEENGRARDGKARVGVESNHEEFGESYESDDCETW